MEAIALVSEPPGSFVYHLTLLFALEAAGLLAIAQWRRGQTPGAGRLGLGLNALFVLHLILFVAALLGQARVLNGLIILPPLARAVSALTVIVIMWLVFAARASRLSDSLLVLGTAGVLIGLAFTWPGWIQAVNGGATAFNGSLYDTVWTYALIGLSALAALVVLITGLALGLPGWGIGLACLLIIGIGHGLHLYLFWVGLSQSGVARLAEIVAVPMLIGLALRTAPVSAELPAPQRVALPPGQPVAGFGVTALTPELAQSLARLGQAPDLPSQAAQVSEAVTRACGADLTLLISAPDALNMCSLLSAYDGRKHEALPGAFFSAEGLPRLKATLTQSELTSLDPLADSIELQRLSGSVGVATIGPALLAPLIDPGAAQGFAVLALINTSGRAFTSHQRAVLEALRGPARDALHDVDGDRLAVEREHERLKTELKRAEEERQAARAETDRLAVALEQANAETKQLNQAILDLRGEMQGHDSVASRIVELGGQLTAVQLALRASEGRASEAESALAAARAAHEAAEARATEAERSLATLQTDLAALETAGGVGALSLAERQRLLAEIEGLRDQVESGQWKIATQQLDYDFLVNQEAQLREELTQARTELEAVRHERQVPTVSLADPDTAPNVAVLQRELGELSEALSAATEALNSRQQALSDREQQMAELDQRLRSAERELHQLRPLAGHLDAYEQLLQAQRRITALESELASQAAQLQRAPDGLSRQTFDVIASLIQELRQPLSNVRGYSDLLLGESVGILGALQRKFLERVTAACERMATLLDELVRVADIDNDQLSLQPQKFDLLYVVDDAIHSCAAQYREKGLNLRLDIGDGLPAVTADRDAVRQILTHLLQNAAGAAPNDGDVVLRIRDQAAPDAVPATGERLGPGVYISISDSGSGIAIEDQPRVFSRLYRADSPLITGLGETGVGLSLAKALTQAQGGKIWFNTTVGRGTTFHVMLPLQPPATNGHH